MYSLFYNYHLLGDVLLIIIENDKKPNRVEKKDDVILLFSDDNLIGVNIINISSIVKIKSVGKIVLPADPLIDVINNKLTPLGISPLPYVRDSGFHIGKVVSLEEHEESSHLHVLKVDVGDQILDIVCGAPNVKLGQKVVVAMVDTVMFDGTKIVPSTLLGVPSNGMLCSPRELCLENAPAKRGILVLDEDAIVGSDFFMIKGGK